MRFNQKQGKLLHLLGIAILGVTISLGIIRTAFALDDIKLYENYMRQLIQLSKKSSHLPFASMIIDSKSGKVLCEGLFDPTVNHTHHAEMVAINNCVVKYPNLDWSNTTLITDAEPCAMCTGAIVWTGISKIVYGTSVTFFVKHHWDQINVRSQYIIKNSPFYKGTVIGGVLHEETDKLFADAYDKKGN